MTKQQAADFVQDFATRYVETWERVHGPTDRIKAEGWAILQAAAALRNCVEPKEPERG